jgi:hypothetical protein
MTYSFDDPFEETRVWLLRAKREDMYCLVFSKKRPNAFPDREFKRKLYRVPLFKDAVPSPVPAHRFLRLHDTDVPQPTTASEAKALYIRKAMGLLKHIGVGNLSYWTDKITELRDD